MHFYWICQKKYGKNYAFLLDIFINTVKMHENPVYLKKYGKNLYLLVINYKYPVVSIKNPV